MSANVVRKAPWTYLLINGEWYQYNSLQSPIGSGAMGDVYFGMHCQNKSRVAVKQVKPQYANIPTIRQRARLEASLMFMHSNLIEMLGYCEESPTTGSVWIVSKFVQGQTIDKFLKNFNRKDPNIAKKICQIFLPVLDALNYLHTGANPILHLDIKPSNIMVENGRNVRLMDLGISSTTSGMTLGSHGMMGTPNYAAPEQFDITYGPISEKTDIYQAGVTLYELITEQNPYRSSQIADTIQKHKELLLPSHPNISPHLLQVLRRATNPTPEQRFSTIAEMKKAIQASFTYNPKGSVGNDATISIILGLTLATLCLILGILFLKIVVFS